MKLDKLFDVLSPYGTFCIFDGIRSDALTNQLITSADQIVNTKEEVEVSLSDQGLLRRVYKGESLVQMIQIGKRFSFHHRKNDPPIELWEVPKRSQDIAAVTKFISDNQLCAFVSADKERIFFANFTDTPRRDHTVMTKGLKIYSGEFTIDFFGSLLYKNCRTQNEETLLASYFNQEYQAIEQDESKLIYMKKAQRESIDDKIAYSLSGTDSFVADPSFSSRKNSSPHPIGEVLSGLLKKDSKKESYKPKQTATNKQVGTKSPADSHQETLFDPTFETAEDSQAKVEKEEKTEPIQEEKKADMGINAAFQTEVNGDIKTVIEEKETEEIKKQEQPSEMEGGPVNYEKLHDKNDRLIPTLTLFEVISSDYGLMFETDPAEAYVKRIAQAAEEAPDSLSKILLADFKGDLKDLQVRFAQNKNLAESQARSCRICFPESFEELETFLDASDFHEIYLIHENCTAQKIDRNGWLKLYRSALLGRYSLIVADSVREVYKL